MITFTTATAAQSTASKSVPAQHIKFPATIKKLRTQLAIGAKTILAPTYTAELYNGDTVARSKRPVP